MKRILIISFVIILLLLLLCTIKSNSIETHTSIENGIDLLTSKSFDGRRPGTEGNIKTQEYLRESLENFNIQPYSASYYWEFPYIFYDVKESYIEADGDKFSYNKDFQIRYAVDSPINITSVLKSEPTSDEKCVLLTEDLSNSTNNDENVQAVILNINSFNKHELIYGPNIRDKLIIVVEEETYRKLYEKLNHDISINIDLEKQQKYDNNVVGSIKADKNPKNQAIVISAHFDHIGSYKDKLYEGALDNASGVSIVLEISKHLAENIKTEEINKDIIIAFFNLEEELLKLGGSKKLAEELESKYDTILNINFDCVGLIGSKTVVGYNNSTSTNDSTVNEIVEMLKKSSIDTISGEYSISDHINFLNGICLYSENQSDVIHSTIDTAKNLNLKEMQQISNLLSDYIIDISKRNELIKIELQNQSMISAMTVSNREKVDIGTCKVIEKDGKKNHVSGDNFYGKLEEAEKIFHYKFSEEFKDILDPSEKNPYIQIYINNFVSIYEKQSNEKYTAKDVKCNIADLYVEEHELNKLYEKEAKVEDISRIDILDVFIDKFNNSIIYMDSDQYEKDMYSIIDNSELTLMYNDYQLYYYYNEMQDGKYLSAIKEIGENKYICYMNCKGVDINTEEDIKKVIEENNTIALWEAIVEFLKENNYSQD